jgi:hypothetical protein
MPPRKSGVSQTQSNKQTVNVKVNVDAAAAPKKAPRKKRAPEPPPGPAVVNNMIPPPPMPFVPQGPTYAPSQSAYVPQGAIAPAFNTAATNQQLFRDLQANDDLQQHMTGELQAAFNARQAPKTMQDAGVAPDPMPPPTMSYVVEVAPPMPTPFVGGPAPSAPMSVGSLAAPTLEPVPAHEDEDMPSHPDRIEEPDDPPRPSRQSFPEGLPSGGPPPIVEEPEDPRRPPRQHFPPELPPQGPPPIVEEQRTRCGRTVGPRASRPGRCSLLYRTAGTGMCYRLPSLRKS